MLFNFWSKQRHTYPRLWNPGAASLRRRCWWLAAKGIVEGWCCMVLALSSHSFVDYTNKQQRHEKTGLLCAMISSQTCLNYVVPMFPVYVTPLFNAPWQGKELQGTRHSLSTADFTRLGSDPAGCLGLERIVQWHDIYEAPRMVSLGLLRWS